MRDAGDQKLELRVRRLIHPSAGREKMGRRKLEIKRIQDKSSRLVTFSKRRTGLFKKARHLSVICDVDVAAFVISDSGKLYEFCSGGYNSNRCISLFCTLSNMIFLIFFPKNCSYICVLIVSFSIYVVLI